MNKELAEKVITYILRLRKGTEKPLANEMQYCDLCDGCGWYEGGKTLQTKCIKCLGTGVVTKELQNILRKGRTYREI